MRRKAQGAIEYLFMIAAALIIVAVVIKYLRGSSEGAGNVISQGQSQINSALNSELSQALSG